MQSATLGEALEKLARYKRLVCPEKVSLEVGHGEARLRFDEWLLTKEEPPALVTDLVFAGVVNLALQGTMTPIKARRLELSRRPANEAMLRRHFRCQVCFDAPHDVLVFDESALALPMVHRNAQLHAVLVAGLEQALPPDDPARTLADKVRETLGEMAPCLPPRQPPPPAPPPFHQRPPAPWTPPRMPPWPQSWRHAGLRAAGPRAQKAQFGRNFSQALRHSATMTILMDDASVPGGAWRYRC